MCWLATWEGDQMGQKPEDHEPKPDLRVIHGHDFEGNVFLTCIDCSPDRHVKLETLEEIDKHYPEVHGVDSLEVFELLSQNAKKFYPEGGESNEISTLRSQIQNGEPKVDINYLFNLTPEK